MTSPAGASAPAGTSAPPRRYRLVHDTVYRYADDVSRSYGRAHLIPRTTDTQRCLAGQVEVEPEPDELRDHTDFYGNTSTYFSISSPHRTLRVRSSSEVEVWAPRPEIADAITWEQAREATEADMDLHEYVIGSPLVRITAAVTEYGAPSFTPGRGLGEVLRELASRIYRDFEYVSGSTTVRTTLGEVLRQRKGVCQDFAQLAVGCLRSAGLAARYVSGYLETLPPPGKPKLQGADASHAWAEVAVPGLGWVGLDPTNDQLTTQSYVIAAWGRDYADVPPLKGVIITNARESTMRVSVDVVRID